MKSGSGNISIITEENNARDNQALSLVVDAPDNSACCSESDETFIPPVAQVPTHNELEGLQGGNFNERFHVSENIYGALVAATDASPENRFATINDLSDSEYLPPSEDNPFITLRAIPNPVEYDPTVPEWVKEITEEDIALWNTTGGNYSAGNGIDITNNVISLQTESKTLVAPVISSTWTLTKLDGTAYSPPVVTTPAVTVDVGVRANLTSTYQYPVPNSTQGLPTAVTGNYGITLPGPATPSNPLNAAGLTNNVTYSVTLVKPKSGLTVVGSQVVVATGNDSATASTSITFSNKLYYGTTTKSSNILDSDVLALPSEFRANRLKTFTSFGGGGTRILIGVPTSFGVASFKVNGLANTAFTRVRSNTDFVNAGGGTIKLDVYLSDNVYNSPLDSFEIL